MKKLKLLLALSLLPALSFAWNGTGHSTGGAIAYYYLKQHDAAAITKITDILKHHPWYNDQSQWGGKLAGLTGERHDVALFMLASTFPDDARSFPELGGGEKTKWHYVDYPLVRPGATAQGQAPGTPNAEQKIPEMLEAVRSERDPEKRALAVCWVFHLIEDVHQPLHTASLFDDNHPEGDRGGNSTFIMIGNSGAMEKLHSYWDGLIKAPINAIPAKAQMLLSKPIYQVSKLTELTADPNISDWILKESFPMAKKYAYSNGKVDGTQSNPTAMPPGYASDASEVAERRIVLAGVRVAQQLAKQLR